MKIDISQVLLAVGNKQKIEETEKLNFEDDSLILSGPVDIKAHVVNVGETVLLEGKITSKVKLECCRCLKEFELPVEVDIKEEYSKKAPRQRKAKKGQEVELSEEDFIFPISEDNKIDLTEAVRQNILTDLPIKPLCNKACKGINNNENKKAKEEDPRLSGLKDIKGKLAKK